MGVLGDFAKGFRIFAVIAWVILIVHFILTNQIEFALLLLVGLIIPLSFLALEYRKNFREFECRKCHHHFKVSHLRLVFTLKFEGKDPAPAGTAAYRLKCPKCGEKSWLVPLE